MTPQQHELQAHLNHYSSVMVPPGLTHPGGYQATELLTGLPLGTFLPADTFNATVNPTGIVVVR